MTTDEGIAGWGEPVVEGRAATTAANYAPNLCARLFSECGAGHIDAARELNRALQSAGAVISGRFGVAGVKKAAELCGFSGGVARNPYGRIGGEGEMLIAALAQVF